MYILHKNAKTKLCTYPNFSYDGFPSQTNPTVELLIYARKQGGQQNEQQLLVPGPTNPGIQPIPTNPKYVSPTPRKRLCNQHSFGNRKRPNRKHRPVSCHLPRRKLNVYKILPKWLASNNGLSCFSFPKRGRQNGICANYRNSSCRP